MAIWAITSVLDGDATAQAVWDAAYADASAWPRWNPELTAAALDGPLRLGATARIRFRSGLRLRFEVVELRQERLLADAARLPGARLEHRHELEQLGDGRCRLVNTITFDGPLASLWGRLAGRRAADALTAGQRAALELARQAAAPSPSPSS